MRVTYAARLSVCRNVKFSAWEGVDKTLLFRTGGRNNRTRSWELLRPAAADLRTAVTALQLRRGPGPRRQRAAGPTHPDQSRIRHVALDCSIACSRPFASSPRGTLEISGSLKSLTGRAHELPRSRFLREYARNLRGPPVGVRNVKFSAWEGVDKTLLFRTGGRNNRTRSLGLAGCRFQSHDVQLQPRLGRNLRGPPVGVPKCEVFGMGGCGQNAPFPHRRP